MSALVIATVSRASTPDTVVDIEFDASIPAAALVRLLASALDWPVDHAKIAIEAWVSPPGRILQPDESLAEAGAWDGAYIQLRSRPRRSATLHAETQIPHGQHNRMADERRPKDVTK